MNSDVVRSFEVGAMGANAELEPAGSLAIAQGKFEHLKRYAAGDQDEFRAYFFVDPELCHNPEATYIHIAAHNNFRELIGLQPVTVDSLSAGDEDKTILDLSLGDHSARLLCTNLRYSGTDTESDGRVHSVVYESITEDSDDVISTRKRSVVSKLAAAIISVVEA